MNKEVLIYFNQGGGDGLNIGQNIKKLRKKAKMTQYQLADELYVSRELVAKWEKDERRPSCEMLKRMSKLFSVDVNKIADKNDIFIEELSECINEGTVMKEKTEVVVNEFLRLLGEKERNIFIMRYYYLEDISVIAKGYRLKETSVYSYLSRTRQKLKKYIEEGKL